MGILNPQIPGTDANQVRETILWIEEHKKTLAFHKKKVKAYEESNFPGRTKTREVFRSEEAIERLTEKIQDAKNALQSIQEKEGNSLLGRTIKTALKTL